MDRAHTLTAILPCNDLDASETFYNRLGFSRPPEEAAAYGKADEYRMLRDGNGGEIHLTNAVAGWLIPGQNPFGLYLYTDKVDDLAATLGELMIGGGPRDREWGMYEFAVADPDETLVRIGWPTRLRGGFG